MCSKKIIVGESAWTVPDGGDPVDLLKQIGSALENGTVLTLPLIDSANRAVTVLINGRTVQTVVVDLGESPRPSEVSG